MKIVQVVPLGDSIWKMTEFLQSPVGVNTKLDHTVTGIFSGPKVRANLGAAQVCVIGIAAQVEIITQGVACANVITDLPVDRQIRRSVTRIYRIGIVGDTCGDVPLIAGFVLRSCSPRYQAVPGVHKALLNRIDTHSGKIKVFKFSSEERKWIPFKLEKEAK